MSQRVIVGAFEAKNFSATLAQAHTRITRYDLPRKFELLSVGHIEAGSYVLIAQAKSKTYLRSLDCRDEGILTPLRVCSASREIPEFADTIRVYGTARQMLWIFQTPRSLFRAAIASKKGPREALAMLEEAFLLYAEKLGAPSGFERSFERFAKLKELAVRPGYAGEGAAAFEKARRVALSVFEPLLKEGG